MDTWVSAAAVVLAAIAGPTYTAFRFRKTDRTALTAAQQETRNASYDNLQEDLAQTREESRSIRDELRAYKLETDRQFRWYQDQVIHLDNEVMFLRQGITEGSIPPLPPRTPWAPRQAIL